MLHTHTQHTHATHFVGANAWANKSCKCKRHSCKGHKLEVESDTHEKQAVIAAGVCLLSKAVVMFTRTRSSHFSVRTAPLGCMRPITWQEHYLETYTE